MAYQTKKILPKVEGEADCQDRFRRVPGTDLEAFQQSTILQVGCGGLGSNVGRIILRKAPRKLIQLDGDLVVMANLGTQCFYEEDLYTNKAFALAKNLRREATGSTDIKAYPVNFQQALQEGYDLGADVVLILVDNDRTRVDGAKYGLAGKLPVIYAGVGLDGTHGYVFVQEPEKSCFGCVFPDAVTQKRSPCPGVPTCCDILQVLAAFVTYAIDTILMKRPRTWNYRTVHLSGEISDGARWIERRVDCPLCGQALVPSAKES